MNRLYPNNVSRNNDTFYTVVENQIEFLYDNEFGAVKDVIDGMTSQEYERFLTDVWNDFMDNTNLWQEIDNSITESVQYRLKAIKK